MNSDCIGQRSSLNDSCTSPTHLQCQKDANPPMILIMIVIPRSATSSPQKANNSQVLCYHYFESLPIQRHLAERNLFLTQLTLTCWIVHICPSNQFRKKYHCSRKNLLFVYKSIISPSHRKYNEYSVYTHVLYYSCITADRIILLPLSTTTNTFRNY